MITLLMFTLSHYNSFSTNVPASREVFNISCCSALSSQIKSVLVHSVSLRSTNMEHNELALLYDLSCQDGKGNVLQQNIPQCFPLRAHGPTRARTVAAPQDTTPSGLLRPLVQDSHRACPPHRRLLWKAVRQCSSRSCS